MSRPLLALACLLTVAVTASSDLGATSPQQVTARQGTDASRRFQSPMVLEIALPVSDGAKRTKFGADIAHYLCDDVSLNDLTYQVRGNRQYPARKTDIEFTGWVVVPNSFDREVDVLMTIRQGTEILGSKGKFKIGAEEGRRTPFRLRVPVSRLRAVTDPASPPVVEITLTVRDNS